jgi:tRNA(Ile2) C34 agmatinyltransferase TiaS
LPKCIDYTGVKGSHSANRKTKFWIQQRSKVATEGPLVWEHRTVRCTPDSVRCTRGLQLELATFGNFQGRRTIIQRTVRCTSDSVRCAKEDSPQKLASFGKLQRLVRYNSPDCPVCTGLSGVHRTVRCDSGATATSAPTALCHAFNARSARADVRRAHSGTPDKEQ